ncbi:MAG: CBS domain-containing protein [Magnetococcales bacterium]|nr:CBS domain-containing protein [Magnetococcales bacterium]MBF0149151.1 CBS domain-containing protein [Magnetococcales bacterium]MBF0172358.1 CBS domain-containing protein [Magnetococcales bacterium]MBF0629656.1 CBS domain-containing protein [Magnetococcales bacterium]
MFVKDVMIRNIRTAKKNDTIRTVADIICASKISGLPVVDEDNHLIGVISEKDILNALLPSYSEFLHDPIRARDFEVMENSYHAVLTKTVGSLMTPRVFSASPNDPIMKAASQMALHRIRRIPVVEEGDQLVGIISLGDIHKAIFKKELGVKD